MSLKDDYSSDNHEDACEFVSSRGLVRSATTHMAVPISSSRRIPRELAFRIWGDVGVIHLPVEALRRFAKWHMWRISKPFILVTGDSDLSVSHEDVDAKTLSRILQNRLLQAWYAQNLVLDHSKLHALPIGLDYHTLSKAQEGESSHSWGKSLSPLAQEHELRKVHLEAGPLSKKSCRAFSNWHFAANRGNRQDCLDQAPEGSIHYQPSFANRLESWRSNAGFAFTSSPFGNGLDCHRTWEAILLGSIPVVTRSSLDCLYDDLPVLILADWSELTIERMEEERARMSEEIYNYAKLTLRYWRKKIRGQADIPNRWMTMEAFRLSMADHVNA
nr:hypothetical protein [uncultured Cohaesibacter sp.]